MTSSTAKVKYSVQMAPYVSVFPDTIYNKKLFWSCRRSSYCLADVFFWLHFFLEVGLGDNFPTTMSLSRPLFFARCPAAATGGMSASWQKRPFSRSIFGSATCNVTF